MSPTDTDTGTAPASGSGPKRRLRLAARVFIVLALLLSVTIVATAATLLYNSATALRDEAEAAAVNLAELLSGTFAEMGEISLANVARTLDSTLDGPMTAQARIAAHFVEAAEAAAYGTPRIIEALEGITRETVLDEFWITDEQGFAYLTNVRDEDGVTVPFRFDPDPAVQPQASKFHVLLAAPLDSEEFITQPAQVREIDQQVYKYVGVGGVDKPRIVQVGDALVFGDQEILRNVYASQRPDVSAVIEGILGQQLTSQATILDRFVAAAGEAGWSADEIDRRLRLIADSTAIGEIRVAYESGTVYSSLSAADAGNSALPFVDDAAALLNGPDRVREHPSEPRAVDGVVYKYVTVVNPESQRLVQVGIPIEGSSGNLLYAVYQREADVLARSRNIEALWIVNLDRDVAAAAPRAELQTGDDVIDLADLFARRAAAITEQALAGGGAVSTAALSFFSPADRGIWVAAPIISTGGIPIGGLAIAVSLDDIVDSVGGELLNTTLIAVVLLGFTAGAALWGARWLTRPIEIIVEAARQVETGKPPDADAMAEVIRRPDELGSLARVFSDMAVQVFNREEQLETLVSERTQELQTTNSHLREHQEALEQDLQVAKTVQAALVRQGNADLGSILAHARMTPAQQVGGDFVDVLNPSSGTLYLVLGDVSGKGVAAALFMAASHSAIKSAFTECNGISAIATEANRRLCGRNPVGLFVTAMLATVDIDTGTVQYVCAGHEPAVVIESNGTRRSLPMTGGLAMGVLDDFEYPSHQEVLAPGDTLFIYTDGLTDAVNFTGELFGKDRLEATLDGAAQRSPEQIVNHIWSEIGIFSAGVGAADDMTCLVIRRR